MSIALVLLAIFSTTFGAIWVAVTPREAKTERNGVVLGASLASAVIVWRLLYLGLYSGVYPAFDLGVASLSLKLALDPLGLTYAVIASTLWVFASVYSLGYMASSHKQRQYFSFFLLSAGTTLGIAFSGNLFTFYLFYELLTFATYPLVVHGSSKEALEAGTRYIKYSLVGASFILAALVMLWRVTGGVLDFESLPSALCAAPSSQAVVIFFLFLIGFGVKAAIMPLHGWLPSAMVAPTPVSALLHAVAVVNAGVFGVLRTVYSVFGVDVVQSMNIQPLLLAICSITILMGSLIALKQDVLKRRLAYSTISQLAYILLGAFILHPLALAGAILHMIFHSTLKIVLFFSAGIVAEETGYVKISELKGVGRVLPLTLGSFGIISLGMVGMLPLSGFWSKYYLMRGSLATDFWILLVVLIISGFLNALYFVPITISAFTGKSDLEPRQKTRALWLMLVPTLILVGLGLVFGLWPGLTLPLVDAVVAQFFSL
ncbi:MAG TPA: proton-conducting membrane transporter [Firmicutes bacterium]|jgi:multicomponent Na+:H+ antiporter subunit D|nr:proton-conducting membrane transporter [Bacillota bacterium]